MLGLWGSQNTQSLWPLLHKRLCYWADTDTSSKFHRDRLRCDLSSEPIKRTVRATRQGAEGHPLTSGAGQKGTEIKRSGPTASSAPRLRLVQSPRRPRRRTTPGGARTKPEVSLGAPDATRRLWLPGRRALPGVAGTRNWRISTGFLWRAWTAGFVLSEFSECSFTWARKWVFSRAPWPLLRSSVLRAIPASCRRIWCPDLSFAFPPPTFLHRPASNPR